MEERNIVNHGDDYWLVLLLLLEMEAEKRASDQVQQFEKDLIYKNRFSSKHEVVDTIHKHENESALVIPPGKTYYRARIFKDYSIEKLAKYYLKEIGKTDQEIKETLKSLDTDQIEKTMSKALLLPNNDHQQTINSDQAAIIQAQKKWKKNVRFKGYGPSESTAPEPDKITNGRANPDHIRYLYVCEDAETPLYEVRPIIGDHVSVARFKLDKEVRLYDLTLQMDTPVSDTNHASSKLFDAIGAMFSRPFNGDPAKYIATQFLAEEIKNMGFDGLRFNSSLNIGGVNVVLFDPDVCKAVSSELIEIKGIHIEKDEALIYKIGLEK